MFTETIDTDYIVLSFLDISTIAYLKQINKYCYEWIKGIPEISCSNMYPLTKSLLETPNFIDNNIYNITSNNFSEIDNHKKNTEINATLLRIYAKYKYPIDSIKNIVDNINTTTFVGDNFIPNICKYCTPEDLEWFLNKGFIVNIRSILKLIKYHLNDVIELLFTNNKLFTNNSFSISYTEIEQCLKYNNVDALKILIRGELFKHTVYLDLAAEYNNIEIFDILVENGFPLTQHIFNGIGKSGNMTLLYRMLNVIDISNISNDLLVLEYAAERGDQYMISILLDKGFPKKNIVTAYAAAYCSKNNDINFMKWLLDRGFKKHEDAYEHAIKYENINVLNWLLQNQFPKSTKIFWNAVASSSVKILDWLLVNNFKIENVDVNIITTWNNSSRYVFDNLIKNQNIDVLIWLNNNNIPYNKNSILDWICGLHINKYPNPNIINIIKWLVANDHESSELTFFFGVCIENYDLIDILIQYQVPYHIKTILYFAKNKRYAVVKYLLEKNIKYDKETYDYLIQTQNSEIINLIISHEQLFI